MSKMSSASASSILPYMSVGTHPHWLLPKKWELTKTSKKTKIYCTDGGGSWQVTCFLYFQFVSSGSLPFLQPTPLTDSLVFSIYTNLALLTFLDNIS